MAPFPLDAAMKKLLRSIDIAFGLALTMAVAMMVITALPSQALAAQAVAGDGRAAGEHRNVPEFNAISVSGSFDVKVRQAAVASVDVQADANLLPFLETVVEDGKTLQIRWKRSASVRTRVTPVITVVVTQLQALASSGDSHVTALQTPQLATSIAGSGNTELEKLQTGQLQVSIAGSGDLTAAGQAGRVVVKISGSGNVHAEALKADDVTISIAGSGNAAVQAEKSLTVSIAGSGDVSYSGAATVKSSVAGSGSVRKR
jgi:hypothetical protein